MDTERDRGARTAEMDIPIGVDVFCEGAPCGRSTYVVVDPHGQRVTHVVVRGTRFEDGDRLVPLTEVEGTTPTRITLRCTAAELAAMPAFTETEYVRSDVPFFTYGAADYLMWPYPDIPAPMTVPVERRRVPRGEEAVPRGARVRATDGFVGRVDEFEVDPASGQVTHLVMRRGHLWGQRDVFLPVEAIDRVKADVVYLKLGRAQVGRLPAVRVPRQTP